jgi:Protein of unknown function (DUF229)
MMVLSYLGKKSKLIKAVLFLLFFGFLYGPYVYKMATTHDKFFEGFLGHKLEHGPHLQALKNLEHITK